MSASATELERLFCFYLATRPVIFEMLLRHNR
jgi:hypothetical protein